jgi:hypothetical protein
MSSSRSIQSAQRRRAGPNNSEPSIPGRGPQPSINSAQMFANQVKPGSGPHIPTGRLAGQHAALQQQQMQQKSHQDKTDKLSSVNKMTIPQAITLITLRLGALETKLLSSGGTLEGGEIDIPTSSIERIERLEKLMAETSASNTNSQGISMSEFNLFKQQFEAFKQTYNVTAGQMKNGMGKEISSLKKELWDLKKELSDIKELTVALQQLALENSQKILELSVDTVMVEENEMHEYGEEEDTTAIDNEITNEITDIDDLKQLVKNELS